MASLFANAEAQTSEIPTKHSTSTMAEQHTVLPSSQLAMTGQYPPRTYKNLRDLNTAIVAIRRRLDTRDVPQYLSFKHVSDKNFRYIDEHRSQLGAVRFTYYPDIATLIIKVPSREHEVVHTNISEELIIQSRSMGIGRNELLSLGATKSVGPTASQKEADASWQNPTLRPGNNSWPSIVIEAGVSESMPRLKQDAAWWISNSGGQVHIVILIKVTKATKMIRIEKYVPQAVVHRTRARSGLPQVWMPHLVSKTIINQGVNPPTVTGDRLILEFQRVVERAPVPPERDIEFTPAILLDATRYVFRG